MAHVIVKLWPEKSDTQRQRLADRIANDVMDVLGYGEESVSVGFEEISSGEWAEKVNKTNIENPRGKLYKKPLRGWLRAARCQTEPGHLPSWQARMLKACEDVGQRPWRIQEVKIAYSFNTYALTKERFRCTL